jgi:hypothetical protein
MPDLSLFSLLPLGFSLGLRHGIDWDHIAAITDITGLVVTLDRPTVAGEPRVGLDARSANRWVGATLIILGGWILEGLPPHRPVGCVVAMAIFTPGTWRTWSSTSIVLP